MSKAEQSLRPNQEKRDKEAPEREDPTEEQWRGPEGGREGRGDG